MKKKKFITAQGLILVTCVYLLSSCTYGEKIVRRYTPLAQDTSKTLPTEKPILLFFSGEPISFEYHKVGIIEVQGGQYSTTADLLDHLKYEAMKNGANAVISVKDNYADRQSGILFSKDPPTNYTSHIYSGIAVRISDQSSVLTNSFSSQNDLSYIQKVKEYENSTANETVLYVLLGMFTAGALIYVAATK